MDQSVAAHRACTRALSVPRIGRPGPCEALVRGLQAHVSGAAPRALLIRGVQRLRSRPRRPRPHGPPVSGPPGRRFDHVFASTSLNPLSCTYLQKFRESGLSDHAALEAVFLPQS
ncbi:MAG: hypothetical protein ACRERE_10925 [Candidatus Entotheonellia bacterium]